MSMTQAKNTTHKTTDNSQGSVVTQLRQGVTLTLQRQYYYYSTSCHSTSAYKHRNRVRDEHYV